MKKYNLLKEYREVIKKVNRDFMYNRCKEYKVRIKKDDELPILCYKYLSKKQKMQPYEIPDDENNIPGFISHDVILEDKVCNLIVAKYINKNHPETVSDDTVKKVEKHIKDTLTEYIKQAEQNDKIARLKRKLKNKKVKK